ncbi:alpha/beta fold hydrolase [Caenispirillum bisanense]|uniref:alpha/beta fold hydrolase n=1 Tax=Caenispirillum bisanense TaxID=414052 RepID=UPI0031CFE4D0
MSRISLVLVPGLLTDRALFAPQLEALSDVADITVANVVEDDSMEGFAARLLADVPQQFAIAGLSMGGYIAQEVMRQAPERVRGLALLDTNARADRPEQQEARREFVRRAESGDFMDVVDEMYPLLVAPSRLEDADLKKTCADMAARVGVVGFARQQNAIINRPDGRGDLKAVRVPALVLCGAEDAMTPPKVHQEMVDQLPDCEYVVIDGCGHLSTLEAPEAVNTAFRQWLGRL